jgi:hypothetical protein
MRITPRGTYYPALNETALANVTAIGRGVAGSKIPVFALASMLVARCTDPRHRTAIGSFGDLALALAYFGALNAPNATALRSTLSRLTPAALDALDDLLALAPGSAFVSNVLDAERMQRAGMLSAPWFFEVVGTRVRIGAIVTTPTANA